MSQPNPSRQHPKLTDQAVDGLPLHHGRTELLEEIMNTPVLDDSPLRTRAPGRPSRYLVPLAAAATVAALATVPLWWGSTAAPEQQRFATAPQAPAEPDLYRVLLDAPGWTVTYASQSNDISYARGDAELEINWYDAASYDDYVEDREHIVQPPAAGEAVEVLGAPGQLWAYNSDDHTVIREVAAGHWIELRAQGIGKAAYLGLLADLRLVGLEDFEASLPGRFVTTDERDPATDAIVAGIADTLGPARGLSPMGTPEPTFASSANSRYDLGATVAGTVACAWLDLYVTGRQNGDTDATADAAGALATARDWPILQEMEPVGDYPEVVWEYADRTADGRTVDGYEGALGCV